MLPEPALSPEPGSVPPELLRFARTSLSAFDSGRCGSDRGRTDQRSDHPCRAQSDRSVGLCLSRAALAASRCPDPAVGREGRVECRELCRKDTPHDTRQDRPYRSGVLRHGDELGFQGSLEGSAEVSGCFGRGSDLFPGSFEARVDSLVHSLRVWFGSARFGLISFVAMRVVEVGAKVSEVREVTCSSRLPSLYMVGVTLVPRNRTTGLNAIATVSNGKRKMLEWGSESAASAKVENLSFGWLWPHINRRWPARRG